MGTINVQGQRFEVPDNFATLPVAAQNRIARDLFNETSTQAPDQMRQQQINQDVLSMGRRLEKQDLQRSFAGNNSLKDFALSAGGQLDKVRLGAMGLLGMGDEASNAESVRQAELRNSVLEEQSPVANFAGRMAGGVLAAAPLAIAAEAAVPAGLGLLGRGALSTSLGVTEGAIEAPYSDETRFENAVVGGLGGAAAEPISMALQGALKRIPFGVLADKIIGKNSETAKVARQAVENAGYDYDALKPDTRKILENISRSEDVDVAVKNAMETEFGFKLTAGEASQDFAQLSAENSARGTSAEAGDDLRQFKVEQNRDITKGAGVLVEETGGTVRNNEAAGSALKDALISARNSDKQGYKDFYDEAKIIAKTNNIDIPLAQSPVADSFFEAASEHMGTHEGLLKDIGRQLARYDVLDPDEFKTDLPFTIPGQEPQSLGVANVEDLMSYLNSKWSPTDLTGNRILGKIKDRLNEETDRAIAFDESFTGDPTAKSLIDASRRARTAFKNYQNMWEAKDVFTDLTGTKKGLDTPIKQPSDIIKRLTQRPEDARRVIEDLQARGMDGAVADIQAYMLKDVMDGAINQNQSVGDANLFSGSKLTNAIKKNLSVLEVVLTPTQFSQLRNFEAAVGKATKSPDGVRNTSNTAHKIMDYLWVGLSRTPVLSPAAGFQEVGANRTMRNAIKEQPKNVDFVMKLDQNHTKLNAVLRQIMDQYKFEDDGALMEDDPESETQMRGALAQ